MKNIRYSRRYTTLLAWIGVTIIFLIIIQILFSIPAPCKWLEPVWGAGDIISLTGTLVLGYVSIWQTQKANDVSMRMMALEEDREMPFIDIRSIRRYELYNYDVINSLRINIDSMMSNFDERWNLIYEEEDSITLYFKLKNVQKNDVLNLNVISFKTIVKTDKNIVYSKECDIGNSLYTNSLDSQQAIPFIISMPNLFCKIYGNYLNGVSLILNIEFLMLNYNGEEYIETVELEIVNAFTSDVLSPVIINKKEKKPIKFCEHKS